MAGSDRTQRRVELRAEGAALATRRAVMSKIDTTDAVREQLQAITGRLGLQSAEVMSFESQRPGTTTATRMGFAAAAAGPERARFHVVSGRRQVAGATQLPHVVAVVAREVAGQLDYVELHSK